MSETNGTPPIPLSDLKEQVERARLQAELKHIKASESFIDGTQDFVNPAEPLFDSPDFIYPWYGENIPFNLDNRLRGELLPVYITEYGLKILRDYARWLMAYNPWAIQICENKVSYICGKGFGYTCAPADRRSDTVHGDKQLCKIAQRFLDRFMERTNWGAWEQQMIKKDTTDGEAFLRFFHLGRGEVTVRPVEPEHVRSPGNQTANQSFGIETPETDILNVQGFWIVENPSVYWYPELVPADQVLHIRSNVGPTAKRGYPCLIPIRQNLSRAANLLKIMSVLAASQSSIAGIRKWKQYSVADIQGFQATNSDFQFTDPISGQQRFSKRYLPGTFLDSPENVDYEFPASKIASAALVEVLQAELRAIASRFNWPEYMVGADASNANYASTQVAEAPGVKQLEREQASYARAFGDGTYSGSAQCGALWRVLALGVRWGGLPREILRRVKLQAKGPSLIARDKEKETSRHAVLNEKGLLGKKTWSKLEGLDFEQEKEDLETEKPAPGEMPQGERVPGQKRGGILGKFQTKTGGVKEAFDPSEHPRGQPGNAGQFGPGGGGSFAKSDTKQVKLNGQQWDKMGQTWYDLGGNSMSDADMQKHISAGKATGPDGGKIANPAPEPPNDHPANHPTHPKDAPSGPTWEQPEEAGSAVAKQFEKGHLFKGDEDVAPVGNLFRRLDKAGLGLSVPEYHELLNTAWKERAIELKVLNEVGTLPKEDKGIPVEREGKVYAYYHIRDPKKLEQVATDFAKKKAKKQRTRESKDASGHEHDPATGQFGTGSGGSGGKEKEKESSPIGAVKALKDKIRDLEIPEIRGQLDKIFDPIDKKQVLDLATELGYDVRGESRKKAEGLIRDHIERMKMSDLRTQIIQRKD